MGMKQQSDEQLKIVRYHGKIYLLPLSFGYPIQDMKQLEEQLKSR